MERILDLELFHITDEHERRIKQEYDQASEKLKAEKDAEITQKNAMITEMITEISRMSTEITHLLDELSRLKSL